MNTEPSIWYATASLNVYYSDAQIPPAVESLYRDSEYSLDVCVS